MVRSMAILIVLFSLLGLILYANAETQIALLEVDCAIDSRFSQVTVKSELINTKSVDSQVDFMLQLPENAFVSNLSMIINTMEFVGTVKEKEEANREFDEAKGRNETAAQISHVPREIDSVPGMELFLISANVAAKQSAIFTLNYQELLTRRLGFFEQLINLQPGQVIPNLTVTVRINEKPNLLNLRVQEPNSNDIATTDTTISSQNKSSAVIVYSPSMQRQRALGGKGLNGNLKIVYDVPLKNEVGHLEVESLYFVHYFTGDRLPVLPKSITFVIDISGSMVGEKVQQARQSMLTILPQLDGNDEFSLYLFDQERISWPPDGKLRKATPKNIREAQGFCREHILARGGTDINSALVGALGLMNNIERGIVVFLTDGHPTAGVTDVSKIVFNAVSAAKDSVTVFTLGYGFDLNFELLQTISYRTGGFPTRIYPGAMVESQLQNFLKHINKPVLYDVLLSYEEDKIDINSLTTHEFSQYFNGSEIVVAGKLKEQAAGEMIVSVSGMTDTVYTYSSDVSLNVRHYSRKGQQILEKLWIYMKVKDLLKQLKMTDDEKAKELIKDNVISLAIQHNLVTPLTSLVVTQSQKEPSKEIDSYSSKRNYHPSMQFACCSNLAAISAKSCPPVFLSPLALTAILTTLIQ